MGFQNGCRYLLVLLCLLSLTGCNKGTELDTARNEAMLSANDWPLHGRDYREQRYSPLAQINAENVSQLSLAWSVDLPDQRGQEATPLIIDGVMYTASAWNIVMALDAKTGRVLWRFDPEVNRAWSVNSCCDAVTRGVAYEDGQIFIGTLDGRLVAVDAKTGIELWSVLTIDPSQRYTITGAPRVVNGKVFIGNGGAEFGVRGYISAYDADNGELLWRFYTVPGNPELGFESEALKQAAETWHGKWWKLGGGGTVWDSMSYDDALNLLYFGVGNGSPWNPNIRSDGKGDNLYLSSIVAVNADTGDYVWHYQTTPGEGWDYTATQHMILADLTIDGALRKVLMQAPKNGFFYVLDRVTGELLSAQPYVPVNWASHIDLKTGRPVMNREAQYWKTGELAVVVPSALGGHNWHPMAYNPQTGLVYIPAQEMDFPFLADDQQTPSKLAVNLGVVNLPTPDAPEITAMIKQSVKGHLSAWNPVTQKEVWRAQYPAAWNGGVLTTAGNLVFQGTAGGILNAYQSTDGKPLWHFDAQTGIVAPPVSFAVEGVQYVSVMAGWGGIYPLLTGELAHDAGESINRSRLLTFKLNGTATLPKPDQNYQQMPDFSAIQLDVEQIDKGGRIFAKYCGTCHGDNAVGGGVVADLRYSGFLGSAETWREVVIGGALAQRGMVSFAEELTDADAESARQFVLSRNQRAHELGNTQRLSH